LSRNEARAMNNLSAVDGGDELIVPLNVVTGGLASPNDTAPHNPNNGPSNGKPKAALTASLRRFFARQGRVVASKLGAGLSPAELLDASRWDAELVRDTGTPLPAGAINDATRADVVRALESASPRDAVAALFAAYVDDRAEKIAHDWESENEIQDVSGF
jgi:hypothetical protein